MASALAGEAGFRLATGTVSDNTRRFLLEHPQALAEETGDPATIGYVTSMLGVAAFTEARWRDEKVLAAFWRRLYLDIDSVFKAHPGDSARHTRLVLRDSVYRVAKNQLVFRLGPALRTVSPRYMERLRLDNATLLAGRIYQTDLALFDSVFVREGSDTRRALERIIGIAKAERQAPFNALRRWVQSGR